MTLFDERTEVLPPARMPEVPEQARPGLGVRVAVLVVVLVVLATTAFATAEGLIRSERERAIVAEARTMLALPESQRIEVDIPGSVLLQELAGRFDRVGLTVRSFAVGPANSDFLMTLERLEDADGTWTVDHLSGALTLSAAQATALVVPPEAQGAMRIDFSGGDMVFGMSVPGGDSSIGEPRDDAALRQGAFQHGDHLGHGGWRNDVRRRDGGEDGRRSRRPATRPRVSFRGAAPFPPGARRRRHRPDFPYRRRRRPARGRDRDGEQTRLLSPRTPDATARCPRDAGAVASRLSFVTSAVLVPARV